MMDISENKNFPTGLAYLAQLALSKKEAKTTYIKSYKNLDAHVDALKTIGLMLSTIYQASTCSRKCYGGPHVLEAVIGRAHNLGSSSITLIEEGYYDEAMNLVRGIGEIANLMWLSIAEPESAKKWVKSSHNERMGTFSPAAVRKRLKKSPFKSYLDTDWYSSLCEDYTHVTPETVPNSHNKGGVGVVGGQYQEEGVNKSIFRLFEALIALTVPVCMYYKFDDALEEIKNQAQELEKIGS